MININLLNIILSFGLFFNIHKCLNCIHQRKRHFLQHFGECFLSKPWHFLPDSIFSILCCLQAVQLLLMYFNVSVAVSSYSQKPSRLTFLGSWTQEDILSEHKKRLVTLLSLSQIAYKIIEDKGKFRNS